MRNQKRSRGVVAVLVVAVSLLFAAGPVSAGDGVPRCSAYYGSWDPTRTCVSRFGSTSHPYHRTHVQDTGYMYFYDLTMTAERCDGYGQNCGFTNQWKVYDPNDSVGRTGTYSFGHTYRTRASWNEGTTQTRFTNAVSPLVA